MSDETRLFKRQAGRMMLSNPPPTETDKWKTTAPGFSSSRLRSQERQSNLRTQWRTAELLYKAEIYRTSEHNWQSCHWTNSTHHTHSQLRPRLPSLSQRETRSSVCSSGLGSLLFGVSPSLGGLSACPGCPSFVQVPHLGIMLNGGNSELLPLGYKWIEWQI